MFAHQHFRAPAFSSGDRFTDAVMAVVPAADVAMLKSDDVAARRHRNVMADPATDEVSAIFIDSRGLSDEPWAPTVKSKGVLSHGVSQSKHRRKRH
jgi:hypothetical protein